jgi:uncharacterized membrane protein
MDQALLAFAVFAAFCSSVLALGALVGWFVLRGSTRELQRKVEALERRLADSLSGGTAAARSKAAKYVAANVPPPLASPPPPPTAVETREAPPAELAPIAVLESPPAPTLAPTTVPQTPLEALDSAPRAARFDWERWMGVRGAALLGGAILALAGILFVQYSIQRGWLGPAQRCVLGFAVGAASVAASWPLLRRGYTVTSEALTGAGVTLLFAATWSAHVRHELVPFGLALAVLVAATALCCWLALRRDSRTIAVFGLIGGFAAPLLLSLGASQPLGLFGYLIVLDLGLLALARSKRWPLLATLGSIATPFVFALWILRHFSPQELPYALLFCAVSSLLFSLGSGDGRVRAAPILGSLTPFFFAIFFAGQTQPAPHLLPIALLLAVLVAGASIAALRLQLPGLMVIAALGSAASVVTWTTAAPLTTALGWELAGAAAGLSAVAHLSLEWASRRRPEARGRVADGVSAIALGQAAVLAVGVFEAPHTPLWPWLSAAVFLCALGARQAALGGRSVLAFASAVGAAATYVLWNRRHTVDVELSVTLDTFVVVALGAGALLPLALFRGTPRRDAAWLGSLAAIAALFVTRIDVPRPIPAEALGALMAGGSALTLFGLLAARVTRPAIGWMLVAVLAWIQTVLLLPPVAAPAPAVTQLLWTTATLAALALLPLLDRTGFGVSHAVWRAAAALTAIGALPIFAAWTRMRPGAPTWQLFVPPLLLAAAIASPLIGERRSSSEKGERTSRATGFAGFASLALLSAAFAFVTFVDRAELAVGAALSALALASVARAAGHGWLRFATLPLAALSFAGGASNLIGAAEGRDFERSGAPLVHWLSYAFAAPAAALFASAWLLRESESERNARRAAFRLAPALDGAAGWFALVGILWSFGWLNVEVVNLFSEGPRYALDFSRLPARDVALSVAWTVFSFTLLVLGVRLDRSALRWTSLVFFLATIAKVFLYDLGEVRGLFRVASLVGLALALLSVSLLYQRFVFRTRAPATE